MMMKMLLLTCVLEPNCVISAVINREFRVQLLVADLVCRELADLRR